MSLSRMIAADARTLAFAALRDYEVRGKYVAPALDALAKEAQISPTDRGLARELAYGVMRRRLTLDTVLSAYSSRPVQSIDDEVRTILRLGAYQLLFLDRIPDHAAVHETVQLCHRCHQPKAAGFVNGVLRTLAREIVRGPVTVSSLPAFRADTVPRLASRDADNLCNGVRLGRRVFADPQADRAGFLSQVLSLPLWIVDRWRQQTSDEALFGRGLWFLTAGALSLRTNLLRCSRDDCLGQLRTAGVDASTGTFPESIQLAGTQQVEHLPGFAEGYFTVQDESAMSAVDLLDPQPGERILDLCAAPGGKTTFLAERMRNEGEVIACETDARRLEKVLDNSRRLGHSIISCQVIREDGTDLPAGPFDAVLVDVPCSNTGVLGKRPEARWRLGPGSLERLVPLQKRLLANAIAGVRPGGRVVYSTCSIEPEENEQVVADALSRSPHCTLNEERKYLPGQPCDGAYQALLEVRD